MAAIQPSQTAFDNISQSAKDIEERLSSTKGISKVGSYLNRRALADENEADIRIQKNNARIAQIKARIKELEDARKAYNESVETSAGDEAEALSDSMFEASLRADKEYIDDYKKNFGSLVGLKTSRR
jgi:F0F1-type ATP synthase membrane subunit b/b'